MFALIGLSQVSPMLPFSSIMLLWIAKTVFIAILGAFLGWLALRIWDALTPQIPFRELIGKDPVSTGCFLAGFLIYMGFLMHGALTAPTILGLDWLSSIFMLHRLPLVILSFFLMLFLALALFHLLDRFTPKMPFTSMKESPVACGIYMAGFFVLLGLMVHAALTVPL